MTMRHFKNWFINFFTLFLKSFFIIFLFFVLSHRFPFAGMNFPYYWHTFRFAHFDASPKQKNCTSFFDFWHFHFVDGIWKVTTFPNMCALVAACHNLNYDYFYCIYARSLHIESTECHVRGTYGALGLLLERPSSISWKWANCFIWITFLMDRYRYVVSILMNSRVEGGETYGERKTQRGEECELERKTGGDS